jgi:hypothetical protein
MSKRILVMEDQGDRSVTEGLMDDLEGIRREMWGRMTAAHLVDGALAACERQPVRDQDCLMREIARRALWHLPNPTAEGHKLADDMEGLQQAPLRHSAEH